MYLFGASGHGKVVVEVAEAAAIEVKGFIDGNTSLDSLFEYKVIHEVPAEGKVFLSMGSNATRKKIAENNPVLNYPTLVHPKTIISKRAFVDVGTVIMGGVTINSGVTIGKHCIINTNSSIDHECTIHNYVHISPNVALAGDVEVGEGTHIGIGACAIQGVRIGKWCTIGAGAVIIRDVPDYAVVVGNPGKVIKYNNQ